MTQSGEGLVAWRFVAGDVGFALNVGDGAPVLRLSTKGGGGGGQKKRVSLVKNPT